MTEAASTGVLCVLCSMKKGVLRNFTKFTGKHRQSLFFDKVTGLRLVVQVQNIEKVNADCVNFGKQHNSMSTRAIFTKFR